MNRCVNLRVFVLTASLAEFRDFQQSYPALARAASYIDGPWDLEGQDRRAVLVVRYGRFWIRDDIARVEEVMRYLGIRALDEPR